MLNMYNEAMEKEELPSTLTQALITLILKKDKEPSDCKNYCPIYLIPVDQQFHAKVNLTMKKYFFYQKNKTLFKL